MTVSDVNSSLFFLKRTRPTNAVGFAHESTGSGQPEPDSSTSTKTPYGSLHSTKLHEFEPQLNILDTTGTTAIYIRKEPPESQPCQYEFAFLLKRAD